MEKEQVPGVIIHRVNPNVTLDMVKVFLKTQLGKYKTRDQEPAKITLLKVDRAPTMHVVIEGIQMSFNEIRRKLNRKDLGGWRVTDIEAYFGIPIKSNGLYEGGHIHSELHKRLVEGRGYSDAINLIKKDFAATYLGGLAKITDTLSISGDKRGIDGAMLFGALSYELAYPPSKAHFMKTLGKDNHVVIKYMHRLGAIQDLCFLNKNHAFAKGGQKFFNTFVEKNEDGVSVVKTRDCEVEPTFILGSQSKRLDIVKELNKYGYVRLEDLNPDVFDLEAIARFKSECVECHVSYKIIGVDGDLAWLAGICQCSHQQRIRWNFEPFTRLTMYPSDKKCFNKFVNHEKPWELFPIVPGLSPLYDNVGHFRKSALKAFRYEWMEKRKKMMLDHQVLGRISFVERKETTTISGKEKDRVLVNVDVPPNGFWNQDSVHNIAYIHLKMQGEDDEPKRYEMRQLLENVLPGKLFGMRNNSVTNKCRLTVVLTVDPGTAIKVGDHVHTIPRPPITDFLAIKRITNQWEDYHPNLKKEKVIGSVEPVHHHHHPQGHHEIGFVYSETRIFLERDLDFKGLEGKLDQFYLGIEATIKARLDEQIKFLKVDGRIVKICQLDNTQVLQVFLKMPNGVDYVPGQVLLEFWCAWKRKPGIPCAYLPAEEINRDENIDGDDDLEDYDDWNEEGEGEDSGAWRKESNDMRIEDDFGDMLGYRRKIRSTRNCKSIPEFFKFWIQMEHVDEEDEQKVANFSPFDISTPEIIISEWQYTPHVKDFQLLDYMLHPDTEHVHQDIEPTISNPRVDAFHKEKRAEIRSILNTYQNQAVDMMVGSKLSVTNGPPGSGKTMTCGYGICSLYCLENGLTVVTSSTNEATDVIFDKIKQARDNLGLEEMRVMRVYASSKEENWRPTDSHGQDILHNVMKRQSNWLTPQMRPIIEKREKEGASSLLCAEFDAYKKHVMRIQTRIMSKQDVLVMTVGVCSDFRLENVARMLAKRGKRISAILMDESSLTLAPTCLSALHVGAERAIIVGDRLQLPPVTMCNTGHFACLNVSWMELLQLTPYGKRQDKFVQLNTQYRMHSMIGNLVSRFTYNGILETPIENDRRNIYDYYGLFLQFPKLSQDQRILCYSYADNNAATKGPSKSYYNVREISIVKKILQKCHSAGVPMSQISVISTYTHQVGRIESEVAKMGTTFEDVKIGTVDSNQGNENGIVILSLVRSQDDNNVGFLSEQRRLNVAISRAKHFLFIVADFKLLQRCTLPVTQKFLSTLHELKVEQEEDK